MPGCVLTTPLYIYAKLIAVKYILPEETFEIQYSKV